MAWSEKPTRSQMGALTCNYEATLFDICDWLKTIGATRLYDIVNSLIDEEITWKAVSKIKTRKEISAMIATSNKGYVIAPAVMGYYDAYLEKNNATMNMQELIDGLKAYNENA